MADLTDMLREGQQLALDLTRPAIVTSDKIIPLPAPPAWVRQVWAEGGILEYYRRHRRLPLENGT